MTNSSTAAKEHYLRDAIATKKKIAIHIHGAQHPIGPGPMEEIAGEIEYRIVNNHDSRYHSDAYRSREEAERQFAAHADRSDLSIKETASTTGMFRITVHATLQEHDRAPPVKVTAPFVFHVDDVRMFSEEVVQIKEPAIIVPGERKSPGGLHIPR